MGRRDLRDMTCSKGSPTRHETGTLVHIISSSRALLHLIQANIPLTESSTSRLVKSLVLQHIHWVNAYLINAICCLMNEVSCGL